MRRPRRRTVLVPVAARRKVEREIAAWLERVALPMQFSGEARLCQLGDNIAFLATLVWFVREYRKPPR